MPHSGHPAERQYWTWNGHSWQPAYDDDSHRWDGSRWRPLPGAFWQPAWTTTDTIRLLAWAILGPAMLVLGIVLATRSGLQSAGAVALAAAFYVGWAITGGAAIRSTGRLREQLLISAAVIVVLLLTTTGWAASLDESSHGAHGQDTGYGLGAILGIVLITPPTLLLVSAGRFAHNAISRIRRS